MAQIMISFFLRLLRLSPPQAVTSSSSFLSLAVFSSSLPLTLTIRSLCGCCCLCSNTAGSTQYAAHSMGGRQIHSLFRDSFVQKVDKKENQSKLHTMRNSRWVTDMYLHEAFGLFVLLQRDGLTLRSQSVLKFRAGDMLFMCSRSAPRTACFALHALSES